jgi:hypothetical protein
LLCYIIDFSCLQQLPFSTVSFFVNTGHAGNCFLLG